MYSVSEQYIQSMAAPLREMCGLTLTVFSKCQKPTLVFPLDIPPLQKGIDLFKARMPSEPRATFEEGWMRADGQYKLTATEDYISGQLSSADPDANGVYPYTSTKGCNLYASGMVTVLCDASIASAQVVYAAKDNREPVLFQFARDGLPHRLLFEGGQDIEIHFLASFYPNRRVRATAICSGAVYQFHTESFLSVNFSDENDLLCLELPRRKVTMELVNRSGFLDPVEESNFPTFQRDKTNAMLQFTYNGAIVPIGRLYLSDYAVTRTTIQFEFSWAMQPLGRTKRRFSWPKTETALIRLDEIVQRASVEYLMPIIENHFWNFGDDLPIDHRIDQAVQTGAAPTITLPFPIATDAERLQLICNAAGWLLRPEREGDVLITLPAQSTDKRIAYGELYEEPLYGDTGKEPDTTGSEYTQLRGFKTVKKGDTITLHTGETLYFQLSDPSERWTDTSTIIRDSDGNELGLIVFAAQGYTLCAEAQFNRFVTPPDNWSMTVTIPDLTQIFDGQTISDGSSCTLTLRNPLIDGAAYAGWWQKQRQWLARHTTVTIKHRGFPELDCGDRILVQLTPDGEYQPGWITQNKWDFKSGALSGSTKIVLQGAVG